MRGKQARKLRQVTRLLHATLVAAQQIPSPESKEEVAFQRRRLFQMLKARWKMLSRPKSLDSEVRSLLSNIGLQNLAPRGLASSETSPEPRRL